MNPLDLSPYLLECHWQERPTRRKIQGNHVYKKKIIFDTKGVIFFKINRKISERQAKALKDCPIVHNIVTQPSFISFNITIPKNFICDSTSLPWADDINGDLHDCGYGIQGSKYGFTKDFWDLCYKLSMQREKFHPFLIFTRFNGVKYFGGKAYQDRRNEKYSVIRHKALSSIINRMGV